jgi:hypothetical protein
LTAKKKVAKAVSIRLLYLILGLATLLVFANSLSNGFNMDDEFVSNGNKLTAGGIDSIGSIIKGSYYSGQGVSFGYRPVALISFAIEHQLVGENAGFSHLINLLIYISTVLLSFYALLLLSDGKNVWMAFFISLLFALHPLHTEVVDSIKNRDELFTLLFGLLALICLVKFGRSIKWYQLAISLLMILLALFSKKSAISIIPALPLFLLFFTPIKRLAYLIACCLLLLCILPVWPTEHLLLFAFLSVSGIVFFMLLHFFKSAWDKVGNPSVWPFLLSHYNKSLIFILSYKNFGWLAASILCSVAMFAASKYIGAPSACFTALVLLTLLGSAIINNLRLAIAALILPLSYLSFLLHHELPAMLLILLIIRAADTDIESWKRWAFIAAGSVLPIIVAVQVSGALWFTRPLVLIGMSILISLIQHKKGKYAAIVCLLVLVNSLIIFKQAINADAILFFVIGIWALLESIFSGRRIISYLFPSVLLISIIIAFYSYAQVQAKPQYQQLAETTLPAAKTLLGLPGEGRILTYIENPLSDVANTPYRISTSFVVMAKYVQLMIFPYPLRYYYGYDTVPVSKWSSFSTIGSIFILALLLFVLLWKFGREPYAFIGLFLLFSGIVLFSNASEMVAGIVGERLVYIASWGFCIALVAAWYNQWQETETEQWSALHNLVKWPLVIVCFVFALMSFQRNSDWKDVFTLTAADMPKLEESAKAHNFLATQHIFRSMTEAGPEKLEDISTAATHFKRAAEIYPYFTNFWYDLGRSQAMLGQWDSAASSYQHAADLDTLNTQLAFDCAYASLQVKNNDLAIRYFQKVIEKEHSNKYAFQQLYNLWISAGDSLSAKRLVNNYSALNPGDSLYFGL